MRMPMPAAVLAGGASRRMGRPKAELPYGAGTLLEFQTGRLSAMFDPVYAVLKAPPRPPSGPARALYDGSAGHAAIHGLIRALEEADDHLFVLAVDLPAVPPELIRAIAARGLETRTSALVPRADGRLQPLAAVWRRAALETARRRAAAGSLSLHGLLGEVEHEVFEEDAWRPIDPSGAAFSNLNTLEDFAAHRERA